MTKQEFQNLLDRYFDGIISNSEKELIENFYSNLQKTESGWNTFSDEKKDRIRAEIFEAVQKKKQVSSQKKKANSSLPTWKIAASILVILGVGLTIFLNQSNPQVKYLTKSTAKGQMATIKLSDGSTVRLNTSSSVSYPEYFSQDLREVKLQGEAFFEVTEDSERPFTVTANDIQTTVLGTSFNIQAYSKSLVSVALVSGKVMVESTSEEFESSKSEVYLSPGEMMSYNGNNGIMNIASFDTKKLVSWKDGVIYLSDASYAQVFDRLTQWYGIEFRLQNRPSIKWKYSGEFKDMSLELVLSTIGYSGGFEYQINDDAVDITFTN